MQVCVCHWHQRCRYSIIVALVLKRCNFIAPLPCTSFSIMLICYSWKYIYHICIGKKEAKYKEYTFSRIKINIYDTRSTPAAPLYLSSIFTHFSIFSIIGKCTDLSCIIGIFVNNPPGAYLQKNLQMWVLLEVKGLSGGIIKKIFF